jgi:CHASE2 domain-containing sensor protein
MYSRLDNLLPKDAPPRRRLLTSFIAGLVALILLGGFGQRIIETFEGLNDADRLAALSLVMGGVPEDALPVTLLDVDDATRAAWGAAPVTPRAALAVLIGEAQRNGAAAILVDFDLVSEIAGAPPDAALAALFQSYPAEAPPMLLVRKIGFTRSSDGDGSIRAAEASLTPYESAAAGKANIRWITTLNDISADRAVRKIRLWQSVCDGATGTAYPSAALAAAALLFSSSRHGEDLDSFLAARVAEECGQANPVPAAWPPAAEQAAAIPYVITGTSRAPLLFRRIGAGQLVTYENGVAAKAGEIDRDPFAGRVVLLGATHSASGDVYETPLGTMPGAIILANSIVQAKAIVETPPVPAWTRNALVMALFLIFAFVARSFYGAPAVVLIGLLSLAALFAISRLFGFAAGVNVIAVAVPGFALFKLVDSIVHIAMSWPRLGWRALLKG